MKKTLIFTSLFSVIVLAGSTSAFADIYGYGGGDGGYSVASTGQVLGAETDVSNVSSTSSTSTAATSSPAAATSTPPTAGTCSVYITSYMKMGSGNSESDVKKLQTFLNKSVGSTLPITGYFGPLTKAAVEAFQTKYASDVLTPWGLTAPTGYVYKTTLREINLLNCSTLTIPVPTLN